MNTVTASLKLIRSAKQEIGKSFGGAVNALRKSASDNIQDKIDSVLETFAEALNIQRSTKSGFMFHNGQVMATKDLLQAFQEAADYYVPRELEIIFSDIKNSVARLKTILSEKGN